MITFTIKIMENIDDGAAIIVEAVTEKATEAEGILATRIEKDLKRMLVFIEKDSNLDPKI